ncbi:MAG: tandem-95 repeat protein [Rubrivivax sp.]|nr:tandem-95 repeat protein [Rubrivivax sp.]
MTAARRAVAAGLFAAAGLLGALPLPALAQGGNVAPVARPDSYTVAQGGTLSVAAPGVLANDTDANGDAIFLWRLSRPAVGTISSSSNGSFTYRAPAGYSGTVSFTYRAYDARFAFSAVTTVTITVLAGTGNQAPTITTAPPTSATVGSAYAYDVDATDPNGDVLAFSLTQAPAGMTINATTGLIAWTPATAGSQAVSVRVADPGGLAATQSFTITVAAANAAPQITTTPITTAAVGAAYSYDVNASDPNGDTLAYSLTQAPSGMTINAANGLIAWTPTAAQAGAQAVTVRVADPGGLAATQSFTITVAAANAAPQITTSPVTTASVGAAYSYDVNATDPNGDVLTWSLTQAPAGMAINASTGLIAWTPSSAQTGSQAVTVRVADPGGLAATQAFTIAVAPAGNAAPQITTQPPTTATVGAAYAYDVNASDPNGDVLTYALTQAPAGMTINGGSGLIAWTPAAAQVGAQAVTVRVADPGGLAATQSFSITVSAAPPPPAGPMTMSCADGSGWQCSGEAILRTDNGIALTRSGVQAYGRSTSDLSPSNPNVSNATGFAPAGGGTAEIRVRKDANAAPDSVAVLLANLAIHWSGQLDRPQIIETFNPTAGRVWLGGTGALTFGALPPSSDLGYYNFATLGAAGATRANYAANRYFPRPEPPRCVPGGWCATAETSGPQYATGGWRGGGVDADMLAASRYHEDGDVHAGNGLPDANGNPTWLPGGSGFGVPVPGSKGYRTLNLWNYRYANVASWFTQDTVNIVEWGGVDEHNKNRRGVVTFGDTTDPAAVPVSGGASYVGVVHGRYAANGTDDPVPFVGSVTVTVNFTTRAVSVSIQNTVRNDGSGASVPLVFSASPTLGAGGNANHLTGVASAGSLSGGVGGRLFGPVAGGGSGTGPAEIGGTFQLFSAGSNALAVGGFIARKQ